jgi:glycosyltransferase involved in cell wall biosynthesis
MSEAAGPITLLLPDLDVGGAQRMMLTLAREFLAVGQQVDIVSLRAGGALTGESPVDARLITLARGNLSGLPLFCASVKPLVRYLSQVKPHAVLSTITGCNLLACIAHRLAGSPSRLVLREAVSIRNASTLRLSGVRWLYPSAHAVVALSGALAQELVTLGLSNVQAIPNPVDAARLAELSARPVSPALNGRRFVASVGRLAPQKDHATTLRAFAASRLRHSHLLAIAGDGPLRGVLQAQALELGLQDQVAWLGEVRNPYALIAGADALVLTSLWEGSPNVVLEAMALGTPVVATEALGGVRELLAGAPGHRLVPLGTIGAIASELEAAVHAGRVPVWVPEERYPARVALRYLELLTAGEAA